MKDFKLEIRFVNGQARDWDGISGKELIENIFGESRPAPTRVNIRAKAKDGRWVNIAIPFDEEGTAAGWISDNDSGFVD